MDVCLVSVVLLGTYDVRLTRVLTTIVAVEKQ